MSLENLRAKWIASPERAAIEKQIADALSDVLRKAMPLMPKVVVEAAVRAVMAKLDELMTEPSKIVAGAVKITDHR